MRSTVALALLAAGASAHPLLEQVKRSMQGHGGGSGPGNSGYSGSVSEDLKTQCLQAHNDGRGAYGVGPLEWDDELAASAAGWADHIGGNMEHSGGDYGENLAYNSNGNPRDMILSQWFDECPDFTGGFSEGAGHYSQCVWKGTQKVGCGMNGDNMLVCQYWPAGNVEGDYDSNVPSGRCVNAASLPEGSGPSYGSSPAGSNPSYGSGDQSPSSPSYGSGDQSPSDSSPSYGSGGQAPTGSTPSYGGHKGGKKHRKPKHHRKPKKQAPKPAEDCDDEDESPKGRGGRGHGRPHGGKPHGGQAPTGSYKAPSKRPRPTEDCDDEDQSPKGRGHHGHGDNDESPKGRGRHGHGDDSDESPFGRGHGRHGDDDDDESPSSYGSSDNGPTFHGHRGGDDDDESPRGGRGGYGDSDSSPRGGHGGRGRGGSDDDCEE
jgi:pathogenesis-related protein 1